MRTLHRKVLRDLWGLRGPAVAVSLVVAAGLSVFCMSWSTLGSLENTRTRYYEEHRFADIFVHLNRAPSSLADRVAAVPGVAFVEARITADVRLEMQGLPEPATGRLISLPAAGAPALNRIHLRRGRLPEPGHRGEALASEAFAEAHGLRSGDVVPVVLQGRRHHLTVVGVALSPEFVYAIQPGQLLPDDRRFGVLWMGREELAAALHLEGAFNDACLTLAPDASQEAVILEVDRLAHAYGSQGAFGRDEQTSHRYLDGELHQLRGMAFVPPSVFLLVAAFLLHVAVGRFVGTQRAQIATLKSFGYTDAELGRHYLLIATGMVLPGIVLGLAAGAWLGSDLTQAYTRFFRFPVLAYALEPSVALVAVLVAVVAAVAGTLAAVRAVVRLPPAAALQPEAPARYARTWLEGLGVLAAVGSSGRMVLRHLARRPLRALLSSIGIALAAAVLVMGNFVQDVLDEVVDYTFFRTQRQEMTVHLVEPSGTALPELAALPGVRGIEPFRAVPLRLTHGYRTQRVGLLALVGQPSLRRPLGGDGRPVSLPDDGLVLSESLADALDVRVGDVVDVQVLEGARRSGSMVVKALSMDYAGLAAYAALPALRRWLGEEAVVSGAFLALDPLEAEDVQARLRAAPRVGGVVMRQAGLRSFQDTVAENLLRMKVVNVVFACILAMGVVYNAARVSLAERSTELATLRVLGFNRGEISRILLGELAVLTLAALPVGLLLGRVFAGWAAQAFETQDFRFPLVVHARTYAFAAVTTALASMASALLVRRRLDRLDLIAVLKARE